MRRTQHLAVAVLVVLASGVAMAQYEVEERSDDPGSRKQVYLDATGEYFGHSPETMASFAGRYGSQDDLAVTLFVSSRSRKSPEQVHQLRLRGLFWWEISYMEEIKADEWFVPGYETTSATVEPQFREAYKRHGEWKRGAAKLELTDDEVRDLIAVRITHEKTGAPVEHLMRQRSQGKDLARMLADEQLSRQD